MAETNFDNNDIVCNLEYTGYSAAQAWVINGYLNDKIIYRIQACCTGQKLPHTRWLHGCLPDIFFDLRKSALEYKNFWKIKKNVIKEGERGEEE